MDEDILMAMIGNLHQELEKINSNLEDVKNELSSINSNTFNNGYIFDKLDDVLKEVEKIRKNTQQGM